MDTRQDDRERRGRSRRPEQEQEEDAALWRELEGVYATVPIHRTLGLSLHIPASGRAEIRADGRESGANRGRTVAGGVLAAMVDSAACQAIRSTLALADRVVTVDLNVRFVHPGRIGETLVAIGEVDHVGGTLAVAHARVLDGDGHVVAIGSASVKLQRSGAGHG